MSSTMMRRGAFAPAQPRSTASGLPRPSSSRPSASAARSVAAAPIRGVRVAAASTEAASAVEAPVVASQAASPVASEASASGRPQASAGALVVAPEEVAELELAELDAEQEQLLSWMLNHSEEQQEADLDEMVDYDEFADDEFSELYGEVEGMMETSFSDVRVGDKVLGKVYEVDEEGAYIDIGEKASGFVPLSECSFAKLKTPLEALRVGMMREFVVVDREDENGQMVLSLAVLEASIQWLRMQQMQQEEVTVRVRVESANRGGLLVRYGPFDGFVPVGQFGPQITVENMESLVGQDIPVQFIEVNEESERLVFSNKRASGVAAGNTQNYKIGDVVLGEVQQVKPYGVFVDIGGMTGLLHVSQVSNQRITSVDKIFHEGDKLKVMILSMDRDRGRITLSTKKLEPTPGDMLRDPQLVFEKADEMAALFRERMEAAAAQALTPDLGAAQQLAPV